MLGLRMEKLRHSKNLTSAKRQQCTTERPTVTTIIALTPAITSLLPTRPVSQCHINGWTQTQHMHGTTLASILFSTPDSEALASEQPRILAMIAPQLATPGYTLLYPLLRRRVHMIRLDVVHFSPASRYRCFMDATHLEHALILLLNAEWVLFISPCSFWAHCSVYSIHWIVREWIHL